MRDVTAARPPRDGYMCTMTTVRTRTSSAMALLVGVQLAGAGVGVWNLRRIEVASARQDVLARQLTLVQHLASEARESYVHQAHTFIEGGAGHLDHLAVGTLAVDGRLAEVRALDLPPAADVGAIQAALAESNRWFARSVVPRARSGTLDHAAAVALHAVSERHAASVERAVSAVLHVLADETDAQIDAVATATAHARVAALTFLLVGIAAAATIAHHLARAVLGPVTALHAASRALAAGSPARAPETGDAELADMGRAFNQMVAQVQAAEARRIEAERLAALGELAGAVAHELMSPLAAMLADPALRTPDLSHVRGETEHARRVVEGLLGFARPGEAPATEVDLATAVQDAVMRATPLADAGEVEVLLHDLAASDLHASPSAVRQVLDNLLRNAIEASPRGSSVEVALSALERPQGSAVVEIRDRGPGIPDTLRARLYEPFATGRPGGTGLGLAVCQRIVRSQGGRLTHLDREGGGTVVRWEVFPA